MAGAHRKPPRRRLPTGFRSVRDLVSYLLGAGVLIYEVVVTDEMRWGVITVAMVLLGLPLALGSGDPAGREHREDARGGDRASWRA